MEEEDIPLSEDASEQSGSDVGEPLPLGEALLIVWESERGKLFGLVFAVGCYVSVVLSLTWVSWWLYRDDLNGLDTSEPFVWKDLVWDLVLVLLFVAQHSLMALRSFKMLWIRTEYPHMERSVYVLSAACTLWVMMRFWISIPVVMWSIVGSMYESVLWWTYWRETQWQAQIGWALMVYSTFPMDHLELLGIKQVLHDIQDMDAPLFYKVESAQVLFTHLRHPIFFGLSFVLWSTPVMTLDRLALAVAWSMYILLAQDLDDLDLEYVQDILSERYLYIRMRTNPWINYLRPKWQDEHALEEERVEEEFQKEE